MTKVITVYSWNVLDTNKKENEVLEFISNTPFDVFCLQEVSTTLLECLKRLPFNIVYEIDFVREVGSMKPACYVAILTPYEVKNAQGFAVWCVGVRKLRTKMFVKTANLFGGGWTKLVSSKGAICIDVKLPGAKILRFFSVHLATKGPLERLKGLKIITQYMLGGDRDVIAGDFNIIDNRFFNPYNWVLGSSFFEATPWYLERKNIEEAFSKLGLTNPLIGKRTITFTRNQTDHILVHKGIRVTARVMSNSFGSDHYPVMAKISIG